MFQLWTDAVEEILVEGNTFTQNGGDPIHFGFYDDYDITAHPEDWEYNRTSVILLLENEGQIDKFNIGTNTIDGAQITGSFTIRIEMGNPDGLPESSSEETDDVSESPLEETGDVLVPVESELENPKVQGFRITELLIPLGIGVALIVVGIVYYFFVRKRRTA